jgi:hypothetical protein
LVSHQWRLIKWVAERTSCTICVEGPCDESTVLFEKVLAFDADSTIVTSLKFSDDQFQVMENNKPVIAGTFELNTTQLQLQHGLTHLDLQLKNVSEDSLIVFIKDGAYGLSDITLVFAAPY